MNCASQPKIEGIKETKGVISATVIFATERYCSLFHRWAATLKAAICCWLRSIEETSDKEEQEN